MNKHPLENPHGFCSYRSKSRLNPKVCTQILNCGQRRNKDVDIPHATPLNFLSEDFSFNVIQSNQGTSFVLWPHEVKDFEFCIRIHGLLLYSQLKKKKYPYSLISNMQVFNFNKMIPEEHYKLVFQITCVFQK